MKPVDKTQVYTDFSGLEALKGQNNNVDALRKVAKQFESIYIQMAMKSMRDANKAFKSDLVDDEGSDIFKDMYDKQLSLSVSQGGNFGLAEAIVRQLSGQLSQPANTSDVKS